MMWPYNTQTHITSSSVNVCERQFDSRADTGSGFSCQNKTLIELLLVFMTNLPLGF